MKVLTRSSSLTRLFGSGQQPQQGLVRSGSFGLLSGSGLPDLTRDCSVIEDDEEEGSWSYLVVEPLGVMHRQMPVYDQGFSTKRRSTEGTILFIDRRFKHAWTTWLRIQCSGEWVFDVSPKDRQVLLIEVKYEHCTWQFPIAKQCTALVRPTFPSPRSPKSTATLKALQAGSSVTAIGLLEAVKQKVAWLELNNGQGWLNVADHFDTLIANGVSIHREHDTEFGLWDYMVIDPSGVQVFAEVAQPGGVFEVIDTLPEGTILSITERRVWERGRLLQMHVAGRWVQDQSVDRGGSVSRVSLMEVNIERGAWLYRVDARQGIGIRKRLSWAHSAKASERGPEHGEVVNICERINCGETTFLRLADKRGWIFNKKRGKDLASLVRGEAHAPSLAYDETSNLQ